MNRLDQFLQDESRITVPVQYGNTTWQQIESALENRSTGHRRLLLTLAAAVFCAALVIPPLIHHSETSPPPLNMQTRSVMIVKNHTAIWIEATGITNGGLQ